MKKTLVIAWIIAFSIMFVGCKEESSSEQPEEIIDISSVYNINGYVQKGPFVSGSSITIQELDSQLEPTGISYQTTTNDDIGSFSVGSSIGTQYIEIIATGYYFNEVSGEISPSTLTLRSISKLPDSTADTLLVNVNLLTTLQKERLKELVLSGTDFEIAQTQVQSEILSIFHISGISDAFDSMDIIELGEKNKVLMAVSSILQADNTVGELSELISKFSLDIKTDGTLDNTILITEITNNAQSVNIASIKANLQDRYGELGLTVTIGTFEDYVDLDGDGIIGKDDDDTPIPPSFNNILNADLNTVYTSEQFIISDLAESSTTSVTFSGIVLLNETEQTSDFKIKNGDKIELRVTSSRYYNMSGTSSITIGVVTYVYTVTTVVDNRPPITIFSSGVLTDGDFLNGNVNYHIDLCNSQKTAQSIPGDNSAAFISIPEKDIKDIIAQDVDNPRKVKSLNGSILKNEWWLMHFQRLLNISFEDAGILNIGTFWWSGSQGQGEVGTEHCNGWTSNNSGDWGEAGISSDTNLWVFETVKTCDTQRYLLCVAY